MMHPDEDVIHAYPMANAVMAIDNADSKAGMEYANTNIGDGGFMLKFGDGTVDNATWKGKHTSWSLVGGDTESPRVESLPGPDNWFLSTSMTAVGLASKSAPKRKSARRIRSMSMSSMGRSSAGRMM